MTHADARGELTEIFRNEWFDTPRPVRWHAVRGTAQALRGVHLQRRAWTYLCLLHGRAAIGLHVPATRSGTLLELGETPRAVLAIPPGIGYGLYFHSAALCLRATSEAAEDVLRCRWDSPGLGIPWPCGDPLLDAADATANLVFAQAAPHHPGGA
jgi:dTDP-4-dehydrorhamnose 3,5-epimerase